MFDVSTGLTYYYGIIGNILDCYRTSTYHGVISNMNRAYDHSVCRDLHIIPYCGSVRYIFT